MWKGIFYNAISKYSGVLINLGITAILSRVLTPSEFGIVALVFVFIGFFNLLGNLGIGPAIVQTLDLTKDDIGSIFVFSGLMAFILALLFFLSAGFISEFYEEPDLVPVVRLLSLSVFFNILSIVPKALNKKELRFKQMGIVNISVQSFTGGVAIFMAMTGFSYYSLVFQNIITGFLGFSIFFYLYPVKIVRKINKSPLKRIASFSTYQFGYNFINYFSRNLDSILIGKYLGNASLGYYNKSYSLMHLPVYNLTHVITPVLHPVLAKHQNDYKYIYNSYLGIIKILAGIGFPLSVFLYFTASELIMILFGPQWERSVPVFQILALSVGLQVCMSSANSIFQATNRTDLLFSSGLVAALFMISGIAYGVFWGESLEAVGYGLVAAFTLNFFLIFFLLIKRSLKQSFTAFLKVFLIPIASGIIAAFAFFGLDQLEIGNIFLEFISNTTVLGIIIITFFMSTRGNREYLKKILKRKSGKKQD